MTQSNGARTPDAVETVLQAPYHRGELRVKLAAEARAILEQGGIDAVTLRAVAASAGVSRQAPYHHFADKSALLAAVAANGFKALKAAMVLLRDAQTTAQGRLMAAGVGYVVFAFNNPALFRLMFGGSGDNFRNDPDLILVRDEAHRVMTTALEDLETLAPHELATASLAAWATVHGLAELINKGVVPTPPRESPEVGPFIQGVLSHLRF